MNESSMLMEALFLSLALSVDAFAASFAYGSSQIKIPFVSLCVIDMVCGITIGLSLLAGTFVKSLIPESITNGISFVVLLFLGMEKLLDGVVKSLIRKYGAIRRKLKFSLFSIRFVLKLYADPETADRDCSKTISPGEAASLALALSLDGIAVGFGAAVGEVNALAVFGFSLIVNALSVLAGVRLGNRLAAKLSFPLSGLSGLILIGMSFLRIL